MESKMLSSNKPVVQFFTSNSAANVLNKENKPQYIAKFTKHLQETVQELNAQLSRHSVFQSYRFSINSVPNDIEKLIRNMPPQARSFFKQNLNNHKTIISDEQLEQFAKGKTLFANQIETATEIAAKICQGMVESKDMLKLKNIAVNGKTQSGKTGTMSALLLLNMVISDVLNKKIKISVLCPNFYNIQMQTNQQMNATMIMYSDLKLFKNDTLINSTDKYYNYEEKITMVTRRSMGGNIQVIKNKIQDVKNKQEILLLLIDEAHYGQQGGSVQDKMINAKEFFKLQQQNDANVILVCISATNYPAIASQTIMVVDQKTGKDYISIQDLNICSFSTLQQTHKINTETFNYPTYYFNKQTFLRNVHKLSANLSTLKHEQYRSVFENQIVNLCKLMFKEGKKGICIRITNDNAQTEQFYENISGKLPANCQVLQYYGEQSRTIKESIKQLDETKPYIVLLTMRGRMSDDFPASTQCFIELTCANANLTTITQSLAGRATGYNKAIDNIPPFVLLPDAAVDLLKKNFDGAEIQPKKINNHIKSYQKTGFKQGTTNKITITPATVQAYPKVLKNVWDAFQKFAMSQPKHNGKFKKCPTGNEFVPAWSILTEKKLQEIEKIYEPYYLNAKLLRPNCLDSNNRAYSSLATIQRLQKQARNKTERKYLELKENKIKGKIQSAREKYGAFPVESFTQLGFRSEKFKTAAYSVFEYNFKDKSNIDDRLNERVARDRRVHKIQVVIRHYNETKSGEWEILAIHLKLAQPVCARRIADDVLRPTQNSIYFNNTPEILLEEVA